MLKTGLAIAALVFSVAGFACDDAAPVQGSSMESFRERAMAQLRTENLEALRASLQRSQTQLSSDTRERYLAEQPGSINATSSARGAP